MRHRESALHHRITRLKTAGGRGGGIVDSMYSPTTESKDENKVVPARSAGARGGLWCRLGRAKQETSCKPPSGMSPSWLCGFDEALPLPVPLFPPLKMAVITEQTSEGLRKIK